MFTNLFFFVAKHNLPHDVSLSLATVCQSGIRERGRPPPPSLDQSIATWIYPVVLCLRPSLARPDVQWSRSHAELINPCKFDKC